MNKMHGPQRNQGKTVCSGKCRGRGVIQNMAFSENHVLFVFNRNWSTGTRNGLEMRLRPEVSGCQTKKNLPVTFVLLAVRQRQAYGRGGENVENHRILGLVERRKWGGGNSSDQIKATQPRRNRKRGRNLCSFAFSSTKSSSLCRVREQRIVIKKQRKVSKIMNTWKI